MEYKTRITKCYLVEVTDKDGYAVLNSEGEPIDSYVFGKLENAKATGKGLVEYARKRGYTSEREE